jgi:hypothetical protein
MALQALKERAPAPSEQRLYAVTETVSGSDGSVILYDIAGAGMQVRGLEWISTNNASIGISIGGVYFAESSDYDAAFVERVLKADTAPVEATFDNVVDLLDWLERD